MISTKLTLLGPGERARILADRARTLRLLKSWTRDTLAERAGISPSSLKRFENTGKASLELVLKVAHALGRLEEFDQLLQAPLVQSIEELEQRTAQPTRKRGRI